ncbi:MAG TPA: electron transport complex subunit RsxC [Mariprofundaceae bacterium]|nr:electron transport complex subunit RsxC [Mariprofundaceae bacterium]
MLQTLFRRAMGGFPGGVHPSQQKLTEAAPIRECPVPPLLILPVKQHIGEVCAPLVDVGDRVLRGQKVAKSQGYVSVPVHASTSGTVVKLEEHPVPHPSGLGRLSIFIEPDGEDAWDESLTPMPDYREQEPSVVRERIRLGGIAGLGGAVFPSFIKLHDHRNPIDTVILNGVECEPYLTNDHRLMLERAEEMIRGMDVIMHVAGAKNGIIAIEDNKQDAAEAVRDALQRIDGTEGISVRVLPTRYPQGGEKQLVQALTGREVPSGKLPAQVGLLCHNVGTAKAIHDAVVLGRALTERVVTVSGDAVPNPTNMSVRLGTPMPFLFARAGLEDLEGMRVIHGGPMMGECLPRTDVPVVKSTNGVLAMKSGGLYSEHAVEQPCIRCAKCVEVCPVGLVPNELAWHCRHDQFDRGQEYDLFDCIECGCCSYVCPSHIPLVHYFRYAKGQVAKIEQERAFAEQSKARNEARDNRLAREQAERAAKRSRVKQQRSKTTDAKPAAIEADAPEQEKKGDSE